MSKGDKQRGKPRRVAAHLAGLGVIHERRLTKAFGKHGNSARISFLHRAVQHSSAQGVLIPDDLVTSVAPFGWGHIALTGDYL